MILTQTKLIKSYFFFFFYNLASQCGYFGITAKFILHSCRVSFSNITVFTEAKSVPAVVLWLLRQNKHKRSQGQTCVSKTRRSVCLLHLQWAAPNVFSGSLISFGFILNSCRGSQPTPQKKGVILGRDRH